MWRPDNWDEIRKAENIGDSDIYEDVVAEGCFEAGADAMLEALKKEGLTAEVIEKVFAKSNDTD